MNSFERLAYWLIGGSRGGRNRARILLTLAKQPLNLHRLAERLGMDYKTAQHHVSLLEQNGFVDPVGRKYGKVFVPTGEFEANRKTVMPLIKRVIEDG